MPKLLLLRHGQASFGAADYDELSELGTRQAGLAAIELERRREPIALLKAGSLRRQAQTAVPVATSTGLTPVTDPRWNEYDSADLLAAHSSSGLRMDGVATISSRGFQPILENGIRAWAGAGEATPARESWPAFRARADAALQAAVAELGSGQTGVVCTSGGVIAAICTTLLGGDLETFIALNRTVVNGALTTVIAGVSGHNLLTFNEHGHLAGSEPSLVTFR